MLLAHFLALLQVAAGFGAGLVEVLERCAGQFQLAGRFEADGAVLAAHGDDLPGLFNRLPAIAAHAHQYVENAARFLVGGGAEIVLLVDELLVLGADAPVRRRLLASLHRFDQLVAALDQPLLPLGRLASAHGKPVRMLDARAPVLFAAIPGAMIQAQSPALAIHTAVAASDAVSPRRIRGPSEMARA